MKPKSIYLDAGNDELKILFIVPENPKKAIYATAILEKIFTLYPRAKITILGKMPAVSLFGATPNTDKILIVEKAYYLDAIKKVLSSKWDIIIDAENLPLSFFARAKNKARVLKSSTEKNPLSLYADMLNLDKNNLNPIIWLAPELIQGATKRLFKKEHIIGVAPFDDDGNFIWEPEKFVTLLKRLTCPGNIFPASAIAVIGFEKNRIMANKILAELPDWQRVNLVGGLGFLSMAACIQKCRFFLGGDNIMTHMAAIENVATLIIISQKNVDIPNGRYLDIIQKLNPSVDELEKAVKNLWNGKLSQ